MLKVDAAANRFNLSSETKKGFDKSKNENIIKIMANPELTLQLSKLMDIVSIVTNHLEKKANILTS